MLKQILPFLFLSLSLNVLSQVVSNKVVVDGSLQKAFENLDGNEKISVFLTKKQGFKLTENQDLKINSRLGNVLTAQITLSYLPKLLNNPAIESIDYVGFEMPVMDSAKYHTNALAVQKGWGGLEQAYTGKGVILGIVDSGIDFDHLEFRDANDETKTRILSVWCQWDSTGTKPDSFSYGSEYTKSELEDEINGVTEGSIPQTDFDPTNRGALGHGTHVAGISGGLSGIAPDADIIAVSVLWQSASVVDGVKYVLDKAIEERKPCIVNLSLGSMYDLHDGTGARAEAYKALANRNPEGTIICAAAGNSGNSNVHWGNFSADTLKSVYVYGDPLELVMAIPDSLIDSIKFKITGFTGKFDYAEDLFDSLEEFRSTQWITPGKLLNDSFNQDLYYKGMFEIGGTVKAALRPLNKGSEHHMFLLEIDDHADIDVRQKPPKANGIDLYRIDVEGSGTFNAWLMYVSPTYSGSFSRYCTDPEDIGAPFVENYKGPDNGFSIIAPAVFKETFAIGAYVNRWSYFDVLGQQQPARWGRKPSGSLATFSSRGPSVDGRVLPEIVAPGQNVIAAIPDYYSGWSPKVKDGTFASNSGTSMSTPVVSGAIAMYFEKFPNATIDDIRRDFLDNTIEDEYTASNGQLPNNHWGNGKLDIFKVMSGGIFFSQNELNAAKLKVYPNPTSDVLLIEGAFNRASIFDLNGKQLIQNNGSNNTLKLSGLSSGTYILRIEQEGSIQTAKITVVR